VAAASAVVLAACGVSAGSGQATVAGGPAPAKVEAGSFQGRGAPQFLRRAARSTAEVATQKASIRVEADGSPITFALTAEGEFDNTRSRSHLTTAIEDAQGLGGGSDGTFSVELVIDGQTVYVKSTLLTKFAGQDKPWLKVDAEEWNKSGSSFGGGGQNDPGAFLKFLEGAGDEVTTVGREDVRGVPTTHVRTTLDVAKVVAGASGAERRKLDDQLDGLGGTGEALRHIPADAWLDDDGYVRKVTLSFGAPGTGGGPAVTAKVVVELYDFNEPVDVKVPDPADVAMLDPSLLGGD